MTEPTQIGQYTICEAIASGAMASVHFGRFAGPGGFARTVAVKRMHPHLAKDPDFALMFVDEARTAARIRHPNVVATLDVLTASGELLIVMEYVHGESLGALMRLAAARKSRIPAPVACALLTDVLLGLHAAHEAADDHGQPLGIVHRDVSPENVLVGADGTARVLDFGVAKAVGRLQVTREGQVKGKIAYMAPEQIRRGEVGRATDTYSAAVVLWELLTGRRLFEGERDAELIDKILFGAVDAPAAIAPNVPEELNGVVLRGLARNPAERFPTAREMVRALRQAVRAATTSEVSDWVGSIAGDELAARAATLAAIDRETSATATAMAVATAALPVPAEVRRRRIGRRAGLLTIAISALGVLGLFVVRSTSAPGAEDPRRPAASATETPTARELPAVAAETVPASPAIAESPASASSLPVTLLAPSAPLILPSKSGGGPAQSPPRRTSRPASPMQRPPDHVACDPPYMTDADGTRHYKLNCL